MTLHTLFALLKTMKIPGIFQVMSDYKSFVRMHFVYSALESGLLEVLQTPCSRESLLNRLKVEQPEVLDAILKVGVSVKELSYENGLYGIKGKDRNQLLMKKAMLSRLWFKRLPPTITHHIEMLRN